MKISDGYNCGAMKYKYLSDIQALFHHQCRKCRYITEGHQKILVIVPLDKFNFVKYKPKTYKRKDIEIAMNRLICENCGTTIRIKNSNRPNSKILKVGTFDDPSIFKADIAIRTFDKQKFRHIRVI